MRTKPLALFDARVAGDGSASPVPVSTTRDELKKTLGVFPLMMLGVGGTIGTGIFFTLAEAVPNMPASIVADFHEVLATGKPLLNRQATGRPGAPERTWLATYFPVRSEDGRSLGIGIVAQDMTEQLAAEAGLRESEVRKSAIISGVKPGKTVSSLERFSTRSICSQCWKK